MKQGVKRFVLGAAALWLLTAAAASSDPTAEDYAAPALPHARIVFRDAFGGQNVVDVEVAASEKTRQRGLMWRKTLRDGQGMVFVFPRAQEHSFWMQHTLIPLDMIFFDDRWRIVGVLEGVPPENLESRTVGHPSRYVLEVPAGWCARAGLRGDSKVRAEGL